MRIDGEPISTQQGHCRDNASRLRPYAGQLHEKSF
jgi:hypothetical protein